MSACDSGRSRGYEKQAGATMNIRNAILSTASLFEVRPGALDFTKYTVPQDPSGVGCPLSWIGYYFGMKGNAVNVAGTFVPTDGTIGSAQSHFFRRMDEIAGTNKWIEDAAICAKTLRYYADMYHGEDVRIAA